MAQIRVAIIGQGRSGRDIHARYLKDDRRFKIVAATDPIKDRRDRAAKELGCDVYGDYHDLFGRDDIDLIVNSTPSNMHADVSYEILKAGYHVLSEKPAASQAKDVARLIRASKRFKKTYAIYQQSRFAPYFVQTRKVIDSGVLGRIVWIGISYSGYARRWDWQTLKQMDGGNLLNTGPHPMDQAVQFFGPDKMPEVFCHMDCVNTFGNAEDYVKVLLRGKNRPLVQVDISSCDAYPNYMISVQGSQGGLQGNAKHLDWRYFNPKQAPKQHLIRKPLCKPDGTPAYCGETLNWVEKSWDLPKKQEDLFNTMSGTFYTMLFNHLTKGSPLVIKPEEVQRQIQIIEECQRQNPRIYRGKK